MKGPNNSAQNSERPSQATQSVTVKRFRRCEWMGWHTADADAFDGLSFSGTCKRCGRRVLMDSSGAWFAP